MEKCPKCGASEIILNVSTGKLVCQYCRHSFDPVKDETADDDIKKLSGEKVLEGAKNINKEADDIITLKCKSCGAEVVINTAEVSQARCHWCRTMLSINEQLPNGSIPDVVLPFKIPKKDAEEAIRTFVTKRKFFANLKFKAEFTTNNIMGVYFPYMLVDINTHATFKGEGEHESRHYTVSVGDRDEDRYDAKVYHVERDFDMIVSDLSIESNKDRLNSSASDKTNNVINAIMPFDTENCVKFDSNYLKTYSSERRDTDVTELKEIVNCQAKDIARYSNNDSCKYYDRGIKWTTEELDVKGIQWQAAYLPVWLYSYLEVKGEKKLLHYVAVNARTKETMGSVPIHMPKLLIISALVEILGIICMLFVESNLRYIFLALGLVFFLIMYNRYRNKNACHTYEKDTKKEISNLKKVDQYLIERTGLTSSTMTGANNTRIEGRNWNFAQEFKDSLSKINKK